MENDLKYYGNYRGKVLSNSDSAQQGRVKVEVYPMLLGADTANVLRRSGSGVEGIPTANLPWCVPAMPLFEAAGSGTGAFAIPDVGTYVWVFFESGDPNQPVYFASATDGAHGLPTSAMTNYPNRRVIETSSGAIIIIDNSTGKIIITGGADVVVQGTNVRINPLVPHT